MRLITIRAPQDEGKKVAELAFSKGIKEVSIASATFLSAEGGSYVQDVIDVQTATPYAKEFIEALMITPL